MSGPISGLVITCVLANIFGCAWLLWWTSQRRKPHSDESQITVAVGEKTGHVWDGDLEEYNNPLPRWWLGLFIVTIVFALGYLLYFPGLGSFAGTAGWTQVGEHAAEVRQAQAKLERRLATVKDRQLHSLAADAGAMALAKNLFAANCSTCHGSDARGAKGFPNLTDQDWLWGNSDATVLATISAGRHGMMPPLGSVLGAEGVNEVLAYVLSLNGRQAPADWVAAGKMRFGTMCAACHGAEATGNQLLGAADLTDSAWLHGGDLASIRSSIVNGRDNQMPAHLALLGDTKVRLLAAYVLSLPAARQ